MEEEYIRAVHFLQMSPSYRILKASAADWTSCKVLSGKREVGMDKAQVVQWNSNTKMI